MEKIHLIYTNMTKMMNHGGGKYPRRLVLNVDQSLLRKLDLAAGQVPTSRSELVRKVLRASVAEPDTVGQQ